MLLCCDLQVCRTGAVALGGLAAEQGVFLSRWSCSFPFRQVSAIRSRCRAAFGHQVADGSLVVYGGFVSCCCLGFQPWWEPAGGASDLEEGYGGEQSPGCALGELRETPVQCSCYRQRLHQRQGINSGLPYFRLKSVPLG